MNKHKKIFVVDDDRIYHFILKNFLNKNDIAVNPCFFENGFDALQILKKRIMDNDLPDLILLDINMPIMDGWQFLEEFKKLKTDHQLKTPLYVVTSSNDTIDLQKAKAYQNEISNYFVKPIDESDIFTIFFN